MNFGEAVDNTIKAQKEFDSTFRELCKRVAIECIEPVDLFVDCPRCGEIAYFESEVFEYGRENFYYCSQCDFIFKSDEAL